MHKKSIITFFVIIIIIFLSTIFIFIFIFSSVHIRPNAIRLSNVKVTSDSVTFDYCQLDSGYSLKSYSYDIDYNGTLTLNFEGTIFKFLSLKNNSNHITIDNVQNINKIVISDSTESIVVWSFDESTM